MSLGSAARSNTWGAACTGIVGRGGGVGRSGDVFLFNLPMRKSNAIKHQEVDVFCFVLCFVLRRCFHCESKCLKEIKARATLLGTDNILGQLSVHIFSPKVGYCKFI